MAARFARRSRALTRIIIPGVCSGGNIKVSEAFHCFRAANISPRARFFISSFSLMGYLSVIIALFVL